LALAGWWRRLWARSGCGGSGWAPGWCGWAVASLLRRCCGGAVCWRPASVLSGRPLRSRAVAGVSLHVCVCLGPVLASHATSLPAAASAAWRGRGRVHKAGWSYGGVGPERGLRGEEEGGGVRSGPGEARTILLLHIISVRPSKQPLMVRTFLKVYMELGSYFLFLQEQIKDIIIISTIPAIVCVSSWTRLTGAICTVRNFPPTYAHPQHR
jgi:hypothetical protein